MQPRRSDSETVFGITPVGGFSSCLLHVQIEKMIFFFVCCNLFHLCKDSKQILGCHPLKPLLESRHTPRKVVARVEGLGCSGTVQECFRRTFEQAQPCGMILPIGMADGRTMNIEPLSDGKIMLPGSGTLRPGRMRYVAAKSRAGRLVTDRAILDAVLACRPRTVMDLGGGEGWLALALQQNGIEVTAVDAVPH